MRNKGVDEAWLLDIIERRMSRRTALKLIGSGSLAAIAAACTPFGSSPTTSTGPTGTLNLANPGEPNYIDPAMSLENYEFAIVRNVYEGLVAWNNSWSSFVPALATSWSSNADASEWTFHLRKGVKFHDGTAFDSTAVKASLTHYDPDKTNWGFLLSGISGIDASDPNTVVLKFSAPSPDILRNQVFIKMISPQLLSSGDPAQTAIGTGPFKWGSRAKGTSITLNANTSYWNSPAGGPGYTKAVLQSISDTNAAVQALQAGSVDIVPRIAPLQLQQLKSNSNLAVSTVKSWLVIHLIFRTDQGPLQDVRVRQAIAYAIDRDAIIKDVLLGQAQKATSLMPPGTYGRSEPSTVYNYDPAKAKSLLQAAGYPNGFSIALASGNSAPFPLVGQAIAGQLKQVGINMQADALEPGVAVNDVLISNTPKHTILLSTYGWVNGGPFHFNTQIIVNHPHYKGADMLALVDKVNHTPDGPDRLKVLADAQEMYAQVIPDFPLYYPSVSDAYTKTIQNYSAPVDAYQIDFTRAKSG